MIQCSVYNMWGSVFRVQCSVCSVWEQSPVCWVGGEGSGVHRALRSHSFSSASARSGVYSICF